MGGRHCQATSLKFFQAFLKHLRGTHALFSAALVTLVREWTVIKSDRRCRRRKITLLLIHGPPEYIYHPPPSKGVFVAVMVFLCLHANLKVSTHRGQEPHLQTNSQCRYRSSASLISPCLARMILCGLARLAILAALSVSCLSMIQPDDITNKDASTVSNGAVSWSVVLGVRDRPQHHLRKTR